MWIDAKFFCSSPAKRIQTGFWTEMVNNSFGSLIKFFKAHLRVLVFHSKVNSGNPPEKNEVLATNHKNSKKAKTIDHDVRYEIECCSPSDKQPDDILLPSDL